MFRATLPEKPTAANYRENLLAAGEYLNGLRAVEPEKRDDTWKADMRSAVEFINLADPILTALTLGTAPEAGPTGALKPGNPEARSLGARFTEDEVYRNAGPTGWGASRNVEMEVAGNLFAANAMFRDVDSTTTSGGVFLPQAPTPIGPRVRQMRLFMRDVLDVVQTGLPSIPYIRETNAAALEYSASAVSEGSAKPEVEMTWELDEASVRKIAAWVTVTSEVIDDAPTLRGYIDGRLAYMLAVREEWEVLNGSGTAPHLKGILQYSDLQLQTGQSDKMIALGLAIGKVEAVDGAADAIAMHPTDYWAAVTTRNSTQFDGSLDGNAPVGTPFGTVWGLPVIRSRALPAGTSLVGSFGLGATLFDRLQTRIVVGNQHSDFFTNNKIAVLAEERVALAVHRPDFFVKVTY